MLQPLEDRWFVLQVRPQSERTVACLLRHKGYEDFLPLYWLQRAGRTPREQVLFPGYVFCRLRAATSSLMVTTPGVIRILGFKNKPVPIEEDKIEALKRIVISGTRYDPWPKIEIGDAVEVVDGPLIGTHGTYKTWKKGGYLIVSLYLLERSVMVAMRPEWVRPVESLVSKQTRTIVSTLERVSA